MENEDNIAYGIALSGIVCCATILTLDSVKPQHPPFMFAGLCGFASFVTTCSILINRPYFGFGFSCGTLAIVSSLYGANLFNSNMR